MISYLKYLNAPVAFGFCIVGCLIVMNFIGEVLEFSGKVAPEWMKLRKFFSRKKAERAEATQMLRDVKQLLSDMSNVTQALKDNTKLTEEMFVQSSRDRIIGFAAKVVDENAPVSREEFNRIFKVHTEYEKFLEDHDMTNGEINIAYRIINESYEKCMRNHSFIEDIRGY